MTKTYDEKNQDQMDEQRLNRGKALKIITKIGLYVSLSIACLACECSRPIEGATRVKQITTCLKVEKETSLQPQAWNRKIYLPETRDICVKEIKEDVRQIYRMGKWVSI